MRDNASCRCTSIALSFSSISRRLTCCKLIRPVHAIASPEEDEGTADEEDESEEAAVSLRGRRSLMYRKNSASSGFLEVESSRNTLTSLFFDASRLHELKCSVSKRFRIKTSNTARAAATADVVLGGGGSGGGDVLTAAEVVVEAVVTFFSEMSSEGTERD
eukprot:CAMPEP_0175057380 /NCGR_PEP_ID=MMETSP0052_2-20121109/11230_1 /TAXON_ID=51329 ORGANISM="Polytomella parva, Strain SAG 63-3" /NCGR_SAMPLE_ID=MMETSP0052_2 /ASSEMBLY_ACC=CAM_ASM_000194 /LENGTH=160 /DNA_ID=CAMNT_0016322583 /DNA_START=95 /DNA_END=577 /DNA_ORIENTATION=-